jgi:hypothetical protein
MVSFLLKSSNSALESNSRTHLKASQWFTFSEDGAQIMTKIW